MKARDIYDRIHARDAADPRTGGDPNHGILMLLDGSKLLARLAAIWPNVPCPHDPDLDEEVPPDTPAAYHLRWLWSRINPDPIPTWLLMAGLPDAAHTRRLAEVAIQNMVVLPPALRGQPPWRARYATQYVLATGRDIIGAQPAPRQQPPAAAAPAPAAPAR